MARVKGTFNTPFNFEGKIKGLIDSRMYCPSYADLLLYTTDNYLFNGFPVFVFDTDKAKRGLYQLINDTNLSAPDSWEKVSGDIGSISLVVPEGFDVDNSLISETGEITISFSPGYKLPTIIEQNSWTEGVEAIGEKVDKIFNHSLVANTLIQKLEQSYSKSEIDSLTSNLNQALNNKVDREVGKSLILNTLIQKLEQLYSKEGIDALLSSIQVEIGNKVDKEFNKSLVANTLITKLSELYSRAGIDNLIDALRQEIEVDLNNKVDKDPAKSLVLNTLIIKLEQLYSKVQIDSLLESVNLDLLNKVDKQFNYSLIHITLLTKLDQLYSKAQLDDLFATKTLLNLVLENKQDKEAGKGLSTNDFDTLSKTKLGSLYNVVLGEDESFYFEEDENGNKILKSNISRFSETFYNQTNFNLAFIPVDIFGIWVNGIKLNEDEFKIVLPKRIELLIPNVIGTIVIQYDKFVK